MCSPPAVVDVPGTEFTTNKARRTQLALDALQQHYLGAHYDPDRASTGTGAEIIGRALTGGTR